MFCLSILALRSLMMTHQSVTHLADAKKPIRRILRRQRIIYAVKPSFGLDEWNNLWIMYISMSRSKLQGLHLEILTSFSSKLEIVERN